MRLVGCDFAGLGDVAEALDEVFEAALQGCGGFGGEVGVFGDEGPEQPQDELGEKEGGGAGCWGEHERKRNIIGWGWQEAWAARGAEARGWQQASDRPRRFLMAKEPRTPKANTGAPAPFDMNSRERKGGKGGPGGPGGRGRDDKRPPSRLENLPPSLVDRGEGWTIWKVGQIDQASHAPAGAEYRLIFDGHDPLVFRFLGAARDRSKEAPPEKAPVGEGAAGASEEAPVADAGADDTPAEPAQPE